MKVKTLLTTALAFVLILIVESRGQHKIQNSVLGNSSAATANGSSRITGTAGQPLIGAASGQSNSIKSGFWAQTIDIITNVENIDTESIPQEFQLYPNFPNPFNPTTTIRFDLPKPSSVRLKIYNLLGMEVSILLEGDMLPGKYKVEFDASGLASGVYLYRLESEEFVRVRKLTLLK